jgi:hypothetical protein
VAVVAIFAGLFAAVGQQAGRLLTTALGWSTTLLFGRVPQSRQILLSLITLGSIAWVAVVAGVLMPSVGTILLAAVPVPSFVPGDWVRLAMLAAAIVLPLVIGVGSAFVVDASRRPTGAGLVAQVLRGYPLAFLLAFTLVFLAVVGVVRKARSFSKRWTDAHIPIVVRPGGYDQVVADLEDALEQAGLEVTRRAAPGVLSAPAHLVATVGGAAVRALVPDRLMLLASPSLEVGIYPSDIAISGVKADVARARAAVASRLTSSAAHQTTTTESQQVEDRLAAIAAAGPTTGADGQPMLAPTTRAELASIDAVLAKLEVDYDEWEVLYRMRLQVERDLLVGAPVGEAFPGQREASPEAVANPAGGPAASPIPVLVGIAGLVLAALDVIVAVLDRFRPGSRPSL